MKKVHCQYPAILTEQASVVKKGFYYMTFEEIFLAGDGG